MGVKMRENIRPLQNGVPMAQHLPARFVLSATLCATSRRHFVSILSVAVFYEQ